MGDDTFRILSIDGGGIRGIFPAKILSEIENRLTKEGKPHSIFQYFDLIVGTSTGGIIALALSFGIPASEITSMYCDNAKNIFQRNYGLGAFNAKYKRDALEKLLKDKFKKDESGEQLRLHDAKTKLCIPAFKGGYATTTIYKTKHHADYERDYHIPAYQIALATSAAPTYFKPYDIVYEKLDNQGSDIIAGNIDGGVYANNPALIGLHEAVTKLRVPYNKLRILSIGTGLNRYQTEVDGGKYGLWYWIKRKKLFDLMMYAQSEHVNEIINLLNDGLPPDYQFMYDRINFDLNVKMDLDCTDSKKLQHLAGTASNKMQEDGKRIMENFFYAPTNEFNFKN